MSEKKSRSWADVEGYKKGQQEKIMEDEETKAREELDMTPEQMKEIEDFRMAVETAPLAALEVLRQILAELRLANSIAFGKVATTDEIPEAFQVAEVPETMVEKSKPEPVPKKPDLTVPANVEGEDKVIEYYISKFKEVATRNGEQHSEEDLKKFTFMFQENNVKLRTPSLATPLFAATARFVEEQLGGEYVGGKGAHFLLPYP